MTVIGPIPYHFSVVANQGHVSDSRLATPEAIAPLRHAVADYAREAGFRGEQLDRIRLAVSEAITNVVLHAYRDQPGQVHVTARVVDNELWVLVADDGVGPAEPAVEPGLGWGLAFITDASDEFTLAERAGGGVEARMVFKLPVASVAGSGETGPAASAAGDGESGAERASADAAGAGPQT